ncbi:unnamed protein product [Symbiodinium sp. CCMP2592]|nr:unnamed protein product [Symbiodinium sp. CCMP2592]
MESIPISALLCFCVVFDSSSSSVGTPVGPVAELQLPVEVVGGAEKVKRTFEELAGDMDVSERLIEYCYDCFKEMLDSETVDNYPTECATLPKEQACTLAQILVTTLDKKRFDRYWDTVDVQNKGAVTFDDFLELLDFEDMPEDVLAKYNDNED